MLMPWGRHKGTPVAKLPRHYMQWLKTKAEGPLQVEVYRCLGLPAPKQPAPETVDQILDRVTREVFERFSERERRGDDSGDKNVIA